ncbi:hypothetical protein DFQ26_004680 [Actinomortierella ambigua]|nr:hypothetical protein DFQ26_004680 [Actinomortierella ambigua]
MARGSLDPTRLDTTTTTNSPQALALTLSQAAAAFRDADFFESSVLYWSAALAFTALDEIDNDQIVHEGLLEFGFDLEQELGLDVQLQEPIELIYPPTILKAAVARTGMLRQQQPPLLFQGAGESGSLNHGPTDVDQHTRHPQQWHTIPLGRTTTPPLHVYIMSALAYLAQHINIRIDILPSGSDTLTSLGPPQRYYGALSPAQRSLYHDLLAIVLATTSHHSQLLFTTGQRTDTSKSDLLNGTDQPHHGHPLTTLLGNEVSATWQIVIPQKRTPHSMPRFFSYLNPTAAATIAGCSTPRNELDIAALAETGVRLIVTLIKESPLPQAWFPGSPNVATSASMEQLQGVEMQESSEENDNNSYNSSPSLPSTSLGRIRNAFVPIENLKAPAFPEIYETILGWCVRTTAASPLSTQLRSSRQQLQDPTFFHPHQNAVLIHCGGGKGRAGIVLAAHLMRFGLSGHGTAGYCRQCLTDNNLHPYDLTTFHPNHRRRRHADGNAGEPTSGPSQLEILNVLPRPCTNRVTQDDDSTDDDDNDNDNDNGDISLDIDNTNGVYVVQPQHCVNRFTPRMTARDAIAYLRAIRPGSIETVIQEKSLRAYGDWLWKQASQRRQRERGRGDGDANGRDTAIAEHGDTSVQEESKQHNSSRNSNHTSAGRTDAKGKDKERKSTATSGHTPPQKQPSKSRQRQTAATTEAEEEDEEQMSDDEGRRGGKKGKSKQRQQRQQQQQQQQEVFRHVPPPPNKIIKLPSGGKGSHHQHHLIVQHNMRARQLQRGQKKNKGGNSSGAKGNKDGVPTSFCLSGLPLDEPTAVPPKLIVLTGLPGSGKSHLVTRLLAAFPEHFVHISQDELGSRPVCERLLAQSMRHQQQSASAKGNPALALPMSVIVDRCNPTAADRKSWYETAFQPDETCIIWFSAEQATCLARCETRNDHPTLDGAKAGRVIKGFAKEFEQPNLAKESWSKTLVEVGDFEGADMCFRILADLAANVPGSKPLGAASTNSTMPTRIPRPAFIPKKVLQRRQQHPSSGGAGAGDPGTLTVSMDKVEEEVEEDEAEEALDEEGGGGDERSDDTSDVLAGVGDSPLVKALQFASPTGRRPAVKKPTRGSCQGNQPTRSMKGGGGRGGQDEGDGAPSSVVAKGVQFATPVSSYARPMQKFPRTPHLLDPLTVQFILSSSSSSPPSSSSLVSSEERTRSPAISRNDLLLPTSALAQVLHPKPHQVLTVEEKIDGANLGFSVVHFKPMSSGSAAVGADAMLLPPPKIRVQNRSHFINATDHWQFKKLDQWLDKYREDVLWLCEGRWRYETRDGKKVQRSEFELQEASSSSPSGDGGHGHGNERGEAQDEDKGKEGEDLWQDTTTDGGAKDEHSSEGEEEEDEYVDEDRVLQDGLAAFVLYGEWLYAKHSIHYTALDSWFVPFDLLDVKTGTFVSRKVFAQAIAQTQLRGPPQILVPDHVRGDTAKMVEWVLEQLETTSRLMRPEEGEEQDSHKKKNHDQKARQEGRVEGLYFRIDQGHRLTMRCKAVRSDFIADEERWGSKEQVANELRWDVYHK